MLRMLVTPMLAMAAILAVSALAAAEETTVIERNTVESVPAPKERVIEERVITKEPAAVQKRTDTVVTTTSKDDNDNDNDNDDNDND